MIANKKIPVITFYLVRFSALRFSIYLFVHPKALRQAQGDIGENSTFNLKLSTVKYGVSYFLSGKDGSSPAMNVCLGIVPQPT